jgi:hypothetical protein
LVLAGVLPLAVASTAGATGTLASVTVCTQSACSGNGTQSFGANSPSFGSGASGEIQIVGTGLAHDGGNVTVTSTAPGVTFSGAAESSTTQATVYFHSSVTTAPGSYDVTLKDDSNPGGITKTGGLSVAAAPSILSLSISTAAVNGATHYTEVVSGTDLVAAPLVTFTSSVNGTKLLSVSTAWNSSTQVTYVFEAVNVANSSPATAGAYGLSVTNPDGGTTTQAGALTVSSAPISDLSPSAFPSANQTDSVVISGSGFQSGATVTFPGCSRVSSVTGTTWNSANSITVVFVQTAGSGTCNVTVSNPAPNAGNGAVATLVGGIGFNTAALVAPTVDTTSDSAALIPGSPAASVTFTGSGFSPYTTAVAYVGTSNNVASGVTLANPTGISGTSIAFTVNVVSATSTLAGLDSVVLDNGGFGSSPFAAGLSIAGPVLTSQSPTDIPVGAPVGTSISLTGTGFTPTVTGTVSANSVSGLSAIINYVNATTLHLVITSPPTSAGTPANPATVSVSESLVGGSGTAGSAPFALTTAAGPLVTSIAYGSGTTGVGVGASAQTITINGSNFRAGVTVGNFKNGNNTTDPEVAASVLSINGGGTSLSVSIAIASGDSNIADGYTVTNTDGGTLTVAANSANSLVIQPAPTITSVTPASALANTTTTFTLAGTGFASGVTVTATADGTCGLSTLGSSTSLSVSCTFGAPSGTAAALLVTNPNGGSANSATVLAGSNIPPPPPTKLRITGEKGNAVVGRAVSLTVTGTGFSAKPSVTSTGSLVKTVVLSASATRLIVRVTASKTARPGRRTLTFTFAKGKVARLNYLIIK